MQDFFFVLTIAILKLHNNKDTRKKFKVVTGADRMQFLNRLNNKFCNLSLPVNMNHERCPCERMQLCALS